MKIADLFIKLGLKSDSYNKGIDSVQKKTSAFSSSLKKVGGIVAGAFALGAIKRFAQESVRLYNIQAQAEQQLLVALKGRKDAQQDLIRQAKDLQTQTLFGDEETIRAQALIAAFVKEKEQIKAIIPLVQDLATAKGMQLSVAADLVSKTLGSTTNALSRYGIQVEGAVGSADRLKSLMTGLNNAFGGQAKAAAEAGAGPIIQLQNQWSDLKEEFGRVIVASDAMRDSLTKTQQLLYVWGSDQATKLEKWAIAFELSDKRAEAIYNQVKKRAKEAEIQVEKANKAFMDIPLSELKKLYDAAAKAYVEAVKGGNNQAISDFSNQLQKLQSRIDEIKGIDPNSEAAKDHIQTIAELKQEITDLKSSLDDYSINQIAEIEATKQQIAQKEFLLKKLTESQEEWGGLSAAMDVATEALKKYSELVNSFTLDDFNVGMNITPKFSQDEALDGFDKVFSQFKPKKEQTIPISVNTSIGLPGEQEIPLPFDTAAWVKNIEENKKQLQIAEDNWMNFQQNMAYLVEDFSIDVIGQFGQAIGELMKTGSFPENFGENILASVGKFISTLGKMLIGLGVASKAFQNLLKSAFTNPASAVAAIAAGAALVALGGAIQGFVSSGGASSAGGSSGLGGSAINIKSVDAQDKELVARVSGKDLEFVLQKRQQQLSRG